jgi:hypothetical protein
MASEIESPAPCKKVWRGWRGGLGRVAYEVMWSWEHVLGTGNRKLGLVDMSIGTPHPYWVVVCIQSLRQIPGQYSVHNLKYPYTEHTRTDYGVRTYPTCSKTVARRRLERL